MAKLNPVTGKGTPGESIPSGRVGIWTEDWEGNSFSDKVKILERMKELEVEHKKAILGFRDLPQSVQFFPVQEIP
jgi:hypothetical protein